MNFRGFEVFLLLHCHFSIDFKINGRNFSVKAFSNRKYKFHRLARPILIRGGSQSWKKYVILVQKRRPSWIWSLLAKKCLIFQTSTRLILYPRVLSFLLIPNSTMANFNYRKLFTFCFFKSWKIAILIQNIAFLLHFEVNRSKMSIVVYNQNSPCTNLVSKESFRLQDKGLFGWTSEI